MKTVIQGGDAYTNNGLVHDATILVEEAKIVAVGHQAKFDSSGPVDLVLDAHDAIIVPGFVDLQINGAGGRLLTEDPSVETVIEMARIVAKFGCTAFLPTVITSPFELMLKAIRAVDKARNEVFDGATVLGSHLEGPFINPNMSGVHDVSSIRSPSMDDFNKLWLESRGSIKLMTLSPEVAGTGELIRAAKRCGIAVAVGHTNADYLEMMEAMASGMTMSTHLFNAMGGLKAREPGAIGAVLASKDFKASIIADGYHVHPAMMDLAIRAKGSENLVLVTDGMAPVGTDLTEFSLYGEMVTVRDGACFMPDGTLAGSVLTMDKAVRNILELTDTPLEQALLMATTNPAAIINEDKLRGSLDVGKAADIVIMDRDLNVIITMVAGKIVYESGIAR